MDIVQEHELSCDVLVAGGGPAGVTCALAAARRGASVILCQDRPMLGGNASSEIRMHICGADASGRRGIPLETEAREGGIIEEIRLETAFRNPQRSASMLDLILYEKCHDEDNLQLFLNTTVDGVDVSEGRIVSVHATRASTEDAFHIRAETFVDCTGDGRLAAEAGATYQEGREGAKAFGESRAEEAPDDKRLGSSLLFLARDMGKPMRFIPPAFVRKFTEEDLKLRSHRTLEYGYWWVEWGGCVDTIKDNETIKHELLGIMLGIWDHIKNGGDHGAENWALTWFGFVPGKRESRRFHGQHRLVQSDLEGAVDFPDAIAYGGWSLDTHPPEGIEAREKKPCNQPLTDYVYGIPLRCCISRDIDNLMFAGRNMSASHIAFASTRVMATCAVVGQGAGTAAALGCREDIAPCDMADDRAFVSTLQQQLIRDDCFIPGVKHGDRSDIARSARVAASSFQKQGEPSNVLSGETRAVWGELGVRPGLTLPGTHRWMSDPTEGLPAWVELSWEAPVEVGSVQIILDTGQHRILTLTQEDSYSARMEYGPQPETVKGYRLEYDAGDGVWQPLVAEQENVQRRRVHRFEPIPMARLRLVAESTWGLDHARVIEVRCYAE
ncbi:MAG: FAD-dependent oxidoreductase [Candidatus Latescibacteria bacterium]|nr:FAD-dependent oxidoreductase [Candidatus Latescibacterota bacterium]